MAKGFPAGIRPAKAKDEAAWRRLWDDFIKSGPEPCADDAPAAAWKGVLDPHSPYSMLVAVDARDEPVGFCLYLTHPWSWSTRRACYLLDLYVAPESRGKGTGRLLIDSLADLGKREGWLKIYWMTQSHIEMAQRLYDKVAKRSSLVRYDLYVNEH